MLEKASSSDITQMENNKYFTMYIVHNSWLWEKLTPFINRPMGLNFKLKQ